MAVALSCRIGFVDGRGGLLPAFIPPIREMELSSVTALTGSVTELHEAVQCGDIVGIWKFAGRPEFINARDETGCTPLAYAASVGNLPALKALVALGGDVNARDENGNSVVLLAAQKEHGSACSGCPVIRRRSTQRATTG
jgi:hypothetical protein